MNSNTDASSNNTSIAWKMISWFFGILFFAIGLVNVAVGNDPFFGVFIILLSLLYLPPVTSMIKKTTGFSIPVVAKVLLGLFILWAALGVGELFGKIDILLGDTAG